MNAPMTQSTITPMIATTHQNWWWTASRAAC